MSRDETSYLTARLKNAKSYLEFGCGGSTALATRLDVRRIRSVESDAAWIAKLREVPELSSGEKLGRLTLHHADIGPVKQLGYPADDARRASWPSYYTSIWDDGDAANADLFLIDGRFRVASTFAVLMRCRPDATIMIHDFWNRPHYHGVLPFLDWEATVDTLGVFRPRSRNALSKLAPWRARRRIQGRLEEFANDPR